MSSVATVTTETLYVREQPNTDCTILSLMPMGEELQVYGDGSVIRDFIYIDDVVRAINNIVNGENEIRVFNLGSGRGTSINEVIATIRCTIDNKVRVRYFNGRNTDVPINYLDISRYENAYGKLNPTSLEEGVIRTADFMKKCGMVRG